MKYCTATSFGTQKAVPLEYKSGKTRIVRNGYLSSQIEKVLPIDLYSTYDFTIRGSVSAMPTTNKNPRIYARQFLHSPQENIWPALRAAKEKAAHSGDKISESSVLVRKAGIEPARIFIQGILSPSRLPIPPLALTI